MLVSEHDILDGIAWSLVSPEATSDGKGRPRWPTRRRNTQAQRKASDDQAAPPKRKALFVLKRTFREFGDDGGTDLAAALTYYSVLAIFPGLIALLSLVGIFGQAQESVDKIIEILNPLITSTDTLQTIEDRLNDLANAGGPGLALVIGILGALWSASGYVGAFSRAMNRIYEVEEGRPFWRMRPMQLIVTVTTVRAVRAGPGDPDRVRAGRRVRSATPSASATTSSPSGTSPSGRCSRSW